MSLQELQEIANEIKARYSLTPRQMFEADELYIPLSLFSSREFGVMETVVKYLVENKGMSLNEIAKALDRDNRTIWSTYHQAKKKSIYIFKEPDGYMVPISIFSKIKRSVLKALVDYCKETLKLKNTEIARVLKRDSRIIWGVLHEKK